jgi:hypothetical protein
MRLREPGEKRNRALFADSIRGRISRIKMRNALVGSMLIAGVSTLGDFAWAELHLRHRVVYGLVHGVILFLCIGAYLGSCAKRPLAGAIVGAALGLAAAAMFYVLAPVAGYSVMFLVWAFIWIGLAAVTGRVLPANPASWRWTIMRGVLAMVGSGIAFYLISGIWRPFNPHGWDYAVHLLSWTIAYLPGFLALLVSRHGVSIPNSAVRESTGR